MPRPRVSIHYHAATLYNIGNTYRRGKIALCVKPMLHTSHEHTRARDTVFRCLSAYFVNTCAAVHVYNGVHDDILSEPLRVVLWCSWCLLYQNIRVYVNNGPIAPCSVGFSRDLATRPIPSRSPLHDLLACTLELYIIRT